MGPDEQEHLRFVLDKLAERMVKAKAATEEARPVPRDVRKIGKGTSVSQKPPGVLFVLGAGCSMQYGLPRFLNLLQYSYDDLRVRGDREGASDRDSLRDRLDPHWRTAKPSDLRHLLERYLNRITGDMCTGYLRLARMAANGYVKAIVNMNFDLLLKQAFSSVSGSHKHAFWPTFKLSKSLRKSKPVIIYTPHGSMEEGAGVPILDLASSDLFDSDEETTAANTLFRLNDVVFLGYSGTDAKIAAALTPNKDPRSHQEVDPENYNHIFVFNLTIPDSRLLQVVVARKSTDLMVTGEAAAFENVMEGLDHAIHEYEEAPKSVRARVNPRAVCAERESRKLSSERSAERWTHSRHFTSTEMKALYECRNLAVYLRSTMSLAEGGRISIEDHATEIFDLCLELARISGVGLTTPEKYLLHCAAYLHDLGYFWAHSESRRHKHAGWNLLTMHGEDTATLLAQAFAWDPKKRLEILPEKYRGTSRYLIETILLLCHLHSRGPTPEPAFPKKSIKIGHLEVRPRKSFRVIIDLFSIAVRPPLLHAIFSTAEELTQGHPFFPSPHPLELNISRSARKVQHDELPLEDPVLDIYLRQKSQIVKFHFDRETVVACMQPTPVKKRNDGGFGSAQRQQYQGFFLLASLAQHAVKVLDSEARAARGCGIELKCVVPDGYTHSPSRNTLAQSSEIPKAVWSALDEQLDAHLLQLERSAQENPSQRVGLVTTVLDLLSKYTDPIYLPNGEDKAPIQPDPESRGIQRASQLLEPCAGQANKHLIYRYMGIRYWSGPKRAHSVMENLFCESFESIYRPAWRFCADKWLYGMDALVMARASLDFGSSRFRDEVILGLGKLLEDKITWRWSNDPVIKHWRRKKKRPERWAFGHDGCTVCTSRLLYVLATARRLLPAHVRESLGEKDHNLNDATGALLRYFIARDPRDAAWWGIEEEQRCAKPLHSADYLAWAVRATAHVLAVDQEIRRLSEGEENWLSAQCGIKPDELLRLFRDLWETLGEVSKNELLGGRPEEPHSYIIGHVSLSYLYVIELDAEIQAQLLVPNHDWKSRIDLLRDVVDEFNTRNPSLLSQFFIWPAEVFLAWMTVDKQRDEALVDKLEACLKSRVWIKSGEGRGSWGYNIDNTQRIVSSLNTFWRLAFRKPERFEPLIKQRFSLGVFES